MGAHFSPVPLALRKPQASLSGAPSPPPPLRRGFGPPQHPPRGQDGSRYLSRLLLYPRYSRGLEPSPRLPKGSAMNK